jgi:DNA-binding NarL/FixJ family response regulator
LKEKIRVLVVNGLPVFREALCMTLSLEKDIDCVGIVQTYEQSIQRIGESRPEVIIVDVGDRVGEDCIDSIRDVTSLWPHIRVVMLSHLSAVPYLMNSVKPVVHAYLSRRTTYEELVSTIRLVHNYECVYDTGIVQKVMEVVGEPESVRDSRKMVSFRRLDNVELAVLKLTGKGMTRKMIAREINASVNEVDVIMRRILRFFRARTRIEALTRGLIRGVISLDDLVQEDHLYEPNSDRQSPAETNLNK